MTEAGLVSVILATYNGASFIAAAIESVRSQTYPLWELIVAIDGSTDDTEAVLRAIEDERITLVMLAVNQGPSVARNAAIAKARGEYIAFIDDDDEWLPGQLARQIALMRDDPDLGLVHGGVLDVMDDGRLLTRMPPRDATSYRANLVRDGIALSSVVVRRSALDRCGVFEPSLRAFEDWDLWTRVLRLYTSAYVPEVVAVVRQRGSSTMHSNAAMLARNRAAVVRRNWRSLRAHGLGRKALAYHQYFAGGLLLVEGRAGEARRRAAKSWRLRPSVRAAVLYAMSFSGTGATRTVWRHLQRFRRLVRA